MSPAVKLLIGLAATLLMGWLWHGPAGNGARLIDGLEQGARKAVAQSELPGISVAMDRAPLARNATVSGQADRVQREGLGSGLGVLDFVREVEGVHGVRWSDDPPVGGLPLLAETLILLFFFYLLGIGVGWLLWGRPKRETYL
jgi:hypothetical protein